MINFYSAKQDNSGAMVSWSVNSKDGSVWARLIKQTGTTTGEGGQRNGTYAGGQTINVKFNADEAGALIHGLRNFEKTSLFHKSPKGSTAINLSPYVIEAKGSTPEKRGLGFSVTQGELQFKIGMSLGQGETLAQFLEFALEHIFSALYSEEKKRIKESMDKKKGATSNPDGGEEASNPDAGDAQPDDEGF